MIYLKNFNGFNMSESLKYHIDNKLSLLENCVFRTGSEAFYSLFKEARELYENDSIELSGLDKDLFENTDLGKFAEYDNKIVPLDLPFIEEEILNEDKTPKLNKPTRSSGPKKYKVYVKNPKTGNIKKINFGDVKGGLSTKINDPAARKSFVARHKCHLKNDKMTAGYWSCRIPRYKNLYQGSFSGFW